MELVLKKDNITSQKVNVIVNTTQSSLKLSCGSLSETILKEGGNSLQEECDQNYPNGIQHGEIAVTNGGNLKCDKVYHTSLPNWNNNGEKVLQELIMSCLKKADGDGYKSLAFPPFGVGVLKYPPEDVAKIFLETMIKFSADQPSNLQKVVIAFYNSKDEVIKAFDAEVNRHRFEQKIQINSRLDQTPSFARLSKKLRRVSQAIKRPSVSYKVDEITKIPVDVLVNSTTTSLDLTSGPVTKAILAAAGPDIQKECETKYPTGIKSWEVADTSGGNLSCKKIYHTSLVRAEWSTVKENYKTLIKRLLDKAEADHLTSIALPVMGTGTLKYPSDEVAECMFETALAFRGRHLSSIIFVVNPKDDNNQKAFKTELAKHVHLNQNIRPSGNGAAFSISLVKGSIADQKVDAIVNSTTPSLNLQSGPVTKAIVKAGGDSLQDECKQNYPNGIKAGEIAVTAGGKLNCKFVYHTTLIQWTDDNTAVKALTDLITNCLSRADQDKLTSIAFPVLGTGVLKYPRDVVSKIIFECFDSFCKNHTNTSLQEVKVVIHPDDTENWRVFTQQNNPVQPTEAAASPADSTETQFELIPLSWSPMDQTDFVKQDQVQSTDAEYQTVVQSFINSLQQPVTIVKVERIQNKTLYYQYQAMKVLFHNRNPGIENERFLWHGTSLDAINSINLAGFNRSYCGKNATCYGQGVYFATQASYSAQDTYAVPDSSGYKYMYQAAVLTGEFTTGNSSYKVPPPKSTSEPHIRYDSLVDNPGNPSIFVIFHDTQAYPQYLITFK